MPFADNSIFYKYWINATRYSKLGEEK